jgi:hypothetical protein
MPEREWIVTELPHLQIVEPTLFDKVQELQSADTPLKS